MTPSGKLQSQGRCIFTAKLVPVVDSNSTTKLGVSLCSRPCSAIVYGSLSAGAGQWFTLVKLGHLQNLEFSVFLQCPCASASL